MFHYNNIKFYHLGKVMNKKQLIVSSIGIVVIATGGILYNTVWSDTSTSQPSGAMITDEQNAENTNDNNENSSGNTWNSWADSKNNSKDNETVWEDWEIIEKQAFFIETKLWKDFSGKTVLEKTGKIVSQEDISVSALANGKVKKVHVKEGDKIKKGAVLVSLEDDVASYWLNLEKSKLWIESAEIDYRTQKVNLDKAISDASIAIEKAKNNLSNTKKLGDQAIEQSELALKKSKTDLSDTKKLITQSIAQSELALQKSRNDLVDTTKVLEQTLAQSWLALTTSKKSEDTTFNLQLEKINNNIKKATLDVENLKKSNIEQLKSFKSSAVSTYNSLDNLIIDIIDFSDTILWITENKKRLNDDYEDYLGIRDTTQLWTTKVLLQDFMAFKTDTFDMLDIPAMSFGDMSQEEFENNFRVSQDGYDLAGQLLKELTTVMDNSVVSVGSLNQAQIDGFKSQINWYQAQVDQSYSWYGSYNSQVISFLNTYKNTENAAEENLKLLQDEIGILEKNRNITDGDLDTALQNNQINLERAKIDAAKTISSLETAIANNEISLEKLKIDSDKNVTTLETVVKNNEIALQTLKIDNAKNIQNAEIALKEANSRYNNARDVREVTLKKMSNNIKLSQNSKNQASNEFSKLVSTSWISGVVTDIQVDEGQNVSVGTPLLMMSSLDNTKVEISLSLEERKKVKVGSKVNVNFEWKNIVGKIESIGSVADANLSYKTSVVFSEKFTSIGWLITMNIPLETSVALFPINLIEVSGEWKWKVPIFKNGELIMQNVTLWKVWWSSIEITSKIDPKAEFIITNISNFDSNRFILQKRVAKKED